MITRTRIVVLLVVVAALFGIWKMDNRLNCAPDERPSLVQVIQRVNPSVVYIERQDSEGNKIGSASGAIIEPGGLVLTAAHVIKNADQFKIVLPDGREFWSDEAWHKIEDVDIGFIQLCIAEDLPFSYLGNSSDLKVGQDIFVIGCPYGFDLRFTVTKGIISALVRSVNSLPGWDVLFQIDAQAWFGNSGGPVYDMQGKIIGIYVGGYYPACGLSVCVPVNIVKDVLEEYNGTNQ